MSIDYQGGTLGNYLLSIDVGTWGCKVIIFDQDGEPLSYKYDRYPMFEPKIGFFEQNPMDFWKNTVKNVRQTIVEIKSGGDDIACVGITGQGTNVICIGDQGQVLRPSISYLDKRAKSFLDKLIRKYSFIDYSASKTCPNLLWLKKNEPRIFKATKLVLDVREYIGYKLTKEASHDCWLEEGKWIDFFASLGFPREWFGKIHEYTKPMGYVTKEGSKETHLKEGTPVIIGPWDGLCSVIGSGLIRDGLAADAAGTTEVLSVASSRKLLSSYMEHPGRKLWLTYASPPLGIVHRWFVDQFLRLRDSEQKDVYQFMNELAEKSPPGSNALVFLPTLKEEYSSSGFRGAFLGLSVHHQMKHFSRSVFEGIAFRIRQILEEIETQGASIKEVKLSGGGAKCNLWNQIRADIIGKPFSVLRVLESSCVGVALLASVAVKIYSDLDQATRRMVHISKRVEPCKQRFATYTKLYDAYCKANSCLKEIHSTIDQF